jgi:hypothetical protein
LFKNLVKKEWKNFVTLPETGEGNIVYPSYKKRYKIAAKELILKVRFLIPG